jgi:hypothetical protein
MVLLVVAGVRAWMSAHPRERHAPPIAPPIHFVDVSAQSGVHFTHDSGVTGKAYLPDTMGSGCAFLDYDNDGRLDILLLNGRPVGPDMKSPISHPSVALYHNNGDGTFTDVTEQSGLNVPMYATGVAVADYDNDGYPDVFISTVLGTNRLFHNRGAQGTHGPLFEDVTQRAGVGDHGWGTSAAWVDFDNDGYPDLFVCRYLTYCTLADDKDCGVRNGKKVYCPPDMYDPVSCLLYHNNGDGTFTDVSKETGIAAVRGANLGVAILDYDGDGWPDIAVANDKRPNLLFHNIASLPGARIKRRFAEIGMRTGLAMSTGDSPRAGMGIDVADINNDQTVNVATSNFAGEGLSLYREDSSHLFTDTAGYAGMLDPSRMLLGFGLAFGDLDNDGRQDLVVVNGHIYPDCCGPTTGSTYQEARLLFHNEGEGQFKEIGQKAGEAITSPHVGRSLAVADFDGDGRLDLLINNCGEAAQLLRNDSQNTGHWLEIDVHGGMRPGDRPGKGLSNREALGARVTVHTGGTVMTRWVHSGSSYQAESAHRVHVGLGAADAAESVEVRFPSGKVMTLSHVPANRKIAIDEPRN